MNKTVFRLNGSLIVILMSGYGSAEARWLQTDPVGYEDQQNLYAYVHNDPVNLVDPSGECSSVADDKTRSACLEKRETAVDNAESYLSDQSVSSSRKEAAFISTFDEETGEVNERTGDAAGKRTGKDVSFTDDNGQRLAARPDGRVVEKGSDGNYKDTSKVVLATGHSHPKQSGGIASRATDRTNESIKRNPTDRTLSRVAPAVIKTPSGKIKIFVNGKEVK